MKKQELINNVVQTALEDVMGDRFGKYSKYIIQERALPDARDGLKPVQRRILYAMSVDGNTFDKQYRKSAKTVGLVIGNYHPHGDSSVYDAMVRLSQNWKMHIPLVDMHGNNGSIDDDPAAAMRYTEARLSQIADKLIEDIDKKTVLFAPNFDDTIQEPTVFPAKFPNLLVNGSTGIAAGYATNIPPHNLNEIIDATIYRIQNPNCSLEDLMQLVKGPDFPTGAIVQGKEGIRDAFTKGKGRIVIRSKTEIRKTKTIQQIVITEIPYEVSKVNIVKRIDEIRINKDIDGILDVRDESDRNGLQIVVDIRNENDVNLILNYLYKSTDLQIYYNYNMVAIVNQRPEQMGLAQLIDTYIVHREDVVTKRSQFLYEKMEKRQHILDGLIKSISILDEVIAMIRASKDKQDAKNNLMETFQFTDEQAEAIVILRLYRLTSTDISDLRKEYASLGAEMQVLKLILSNNEVLHQTISNELKEMREQFSQDRKTIIENEVAEIVIDKTDMVSNEKIMLTVSKDGYIKRVSLRSYQATMQDLPGIKENDHLIGFMEAETLDTLLAFTDKGSYYYLPIYEMEEAKWKDVGSHFNSYLKYDNQHKIIAAAVVKNFDTNAYVVSVTEKGMIKRSLIGDYQVQRFNKAMSNMNLKTNDHIVSTFIAYENDEVAILTKEGYLIHYPLDYITATAPRSQGMKAINLSKEDFVVDATAISKDMSQILLMSEKGNMKRLHFSDLGIFNRATKGEMIVKRVKSNPILFRYCKSVSAYETILIYDDELKEIQAKDIAIMSKDATISSTLSFSKDWYVLKGLYEVKIVDGSHKQNIQNTIIMDKDNLFEEQHFDQEIEDAANSIFEEEIEENEIEEEEKIEFLGFDI